MTLYGGVVILTSAAAVKFSFTYATHGCIFKILLLTICYSCCPLMCIDSCICH
jgi:hypothetical protein